jgi:Glycosyltransferase (GlcNAc)
LYYYHIVLFLSCQGEEISIGLRGFTYGYDYYTAERSVAFHMYAIKENKEKRSHVKLFWENTGLYPGSAVEGMKRLNAIIGMSESPDDVLTYYKQDSDKYGLGQVRPKEWFFRLYGIHVDTKTVEDHLCTFVGRPMQNLLTPLLRANGMGLDLSKTNYAFVDPQKKKEA